MHTRHCRDAHSKLNDELQAVIEMNSSLEKVQHAVVPHNSYRPSHTPHTPRDA